MMSSIRITKRKLSLVAILLIALGGEARATETYECIAHALSRLQTLTRDPNRKFMTPAKIGNVQVPATYIREQQKILARAVLDFYKQNGQTLHPGSKILEIGYGSPALLEMFYSMSSGSKHLKGLDVTPVPSDWSRSNPAIELIQGVAPGGTTHVDRIAAERVASGGPYQLIYGVDVFKGANEFKYGEAFRPTVTHAEYLKWLTQNLRENGAVIMLNDFRAPNVFSRDDVEGAGFVIHKWNETAKLPEEMRKAFQSTYGDDYGELTLTILERVP